MSTMKQREDTKSNPSQGLKSRPIKGHATTAERLEALKLYYGSTEKQSRYRRHLAVEAVL